MAITNLTFLNLLAPWQWRAEGLGSRGQRGFWMPPKFSVVI